MFAKRKFGLHLKTVLCACLVGIMIAGSVLVYTGPSYASGGGGGEEDPVTTKPIRKLTCSELQDERIVLKNTIKSKDRWLKQNSAELKRHSKNMEFSNKQISKIKAQLKTEKDKGKKKELRTQLKSQRHAKNTDYQWSLRYRSNATSNESEKKDAQARLKEVEKQLVKC